MLTFTARGNWYFSYTFIYLYLLHFPSLPPFLPTLLGWFIVSIFPQILMSHMAFLPSVVLISLSPLYHFSIPYCCSAVPCLSLSLLDFKSHRLCTLFVLENLYLTDFNYLLFVISFCVYPISALCPCKTMMSSACLDLAGKWWKTLSASLAVK